MSERYGDCPRCRGHGKITVVAIRDNGDGELTSEGVPVGTVETSETTECGRCDGTGFDGSAEAYPG